MMGLETTRHRQTYNIMLCNSILKDPKVSIQNSCWIGQVGKDLAFQTGQDLELCIGLWETVLLTSNWKITLKQTPTNLSYTPFCEHHKL